MTSDTVTVDLRLDKATSSALAKMTKAALIEHIIIAAMNERVAISKAKTLQTKLDKAEAYIEQARAMIETVMDRWHEYDV